MMGIEKSEKMEEKLDKLAYELVNYSIEVKENDRVLITSYIDDEILLKKIIKYIFKNKAIPFLKIINQNLETLLTCNSNDKRIKEIAKHKKEEVKNYDSFINIRYTTNDYINNVVSDEIRSKISKETKESDYIRINKRKWVLLNYPSPLDAHKAKMNTDIYRNYALDTMIYDYKKMEKDLESLKKLMEKTDMVRIVSPDTDIEFSIKGMPIIPCTGKSNIPDGEIFTAPIRESVNGLITYNVPSPYLGDMYEKVSLLFKNGKIIEAKCNGSNEKINKIFDTDEGARYVGEFSFGINPLIMKPMGDILYDEKIIGSIHFTPGQAYEEANNGNESAIHWDLVLIQRKEYGGGEIYFDHKLIRKDGLFVLPELLHLNYDLK